MAFKYLSSCKHMIKIYFILHLNGKFPTEVLKNLYIGIDLTLYQS